MSRSPALEATSSWTAAAASVVDWIMHDAAGRGWEDVGANAELVARRAMLSRARGKIMVIGLVFFEICEQRSTSFQRRECETWRQFNLFLRKDGDEEERDVLKTEESSKQERIPQLSLLLVLVGGSWQLINKVGS